jgi:hypothetical protein
MVRILRAAGGIVPTGLAAVFRPPSLRRLRHNRYTGLEHPRFANNAHELFFMSRQAPKKKAPPSPSVKRVDANPPVPRSGSGAATARLAMLKKRQMRVTRDAEPEPPPAAPKKKTADD